MWLILSDLVQRLTRYLCFRYSHLELFQEESPRKYRVQYVDPIYLRDFSTFSGNPARALPVRSQPTWAEKPTEVFSRGDLGHPSSDALQGGTPSQGPAWCPVFRKGVVPRTHCAALNGDKGRKERKWCDQSALPRPHWIPKKPNAIKSSRVSCCTAHYVR